MAKVQEFVGCIRCLGRRMWMKDNGIRFCYSWIYRQGCYHSNIKQIDDGGKFEVGLFLYSCFFALKGEMRKNDWMCMQAKLCQ